MSFQTPYQSGCLNEAQVCEGFLGAPPLISQTIADLTVTHPDWLVDLVGTSPFPLGNGTVMQHLIFRGQMPEIERGWDKWAAMQNTQGCDPCFTGCGYNWGPLGGYGLERKETALMRRELRTPAYCVSQIQYTYQYEEVMAQIIKNLWRQVSFFKAYNINFNALTGMAKKYVVDSDGAKPNLANPYVYPNIGTARLSNLNIDLLSFFYEWLRISPDVVPYTVTDGRPIFALMASDELLSRLYRDDPTLRQDVRFSGWANDNLTKYNFLYTIRGMFLPAPIQFPRRFNIVAGEPVEVLPFINGIPMEICSFTGINPAWQAATHEEVLLHGRNPFKVFIGQQAETIGGGTSFGPEPTYLDWFKWVNPETVDDPFRRVGYYANAIQIGIHQQFSDGVFGVLVERVSPKLMFHQNPIADCPVADPVCDNSIPNTGCPCPQIVSVTAVPVSPDLFLVQFGVPTTAVALDDLVFQLQSGGFVTGTVVNVSADGIYATVTFDPACPFDCNQVTQIFCTNNMACTSAVLAATDCRSGQTGNIVLTLSEPIRAVTVDDIITAYFGDGTTADLDVVSVDLCKNEWVVNYAAGFGPTDNPTGLIPPPPPGSVAAYSEFFALMPPDNAATVALGGDVDFPQDGPTTGTIIRAGVDSFILPVIGTYRVLFTVSVSEAGQLVLTLGGVPLAYTVSGRATGTSLITGEALVTTTLVNSVLTLRNPAGNAAALTITPIAGGTSSVAATLLIEQISPAPAAAAAASGGTPLAADLICDRGGIAKVCVPPSTDAACPPCDATAVTQCVTD